MGAISGPEGVVAAALAGNPNVGKSTVFNGLTGLRQHTGNWPGKTVTNARGSFTTERRSYTLVDLPGTYSLAAHSAEEELARDYICSGEPEAVIVVCDATCLERNLDLALQILETGSPTLVCVNMMDEAKRKDIRLDTALLSRRLGTPVVGVTARDRKSLAALTNTLDAVIDGDVALTPYTVRYGDTLERALALLEPAVKEKYGQGLRSRWLALRLLDRDPALDRETAARLGGEPYEDEALREALIQAEEILRAGGLGDGDRLRDAVASALVRSAEELCRGAVVYGDRQYAAADRRLDRALTGRLAAYPVMLALLALVFWLTITGANYPSRLLAEGLFWIQDRLTEIFAFLRAPDWLHGSLVLGVYRVAAWVVSVMLPPMAIFFPLFTLLEDAGYLPRVAYNLDKPFKKCRACGKQALCMCMGFGCNAAGVVGCRIIDSPRERLLAILTNSFMPCNGRFPTLIAILTMFFSASAGGVFSSLLAALMLTGLIVLGVAITFAVTRLLSQTLLKGLPSSFALELPPYRRPQIGRVILRSIFDRTLFVLGRAVAVAAPAGLVIWLMANVMVGGSSVLQHCAAFLDPFARLMGLDGVILLAFILGFPANEIVVPLMVMAYMAQESIMEPCSLAQMKTLFVQNGWTWLTAACTALFSMNHWPCSTTLLTVRKETGSWKWTALAAALPTAVGVALCMLLTGLTGLLT